MPAHLTDDDKRTLLQLRSAGESQQAIAAALGCHQSTVCRFLEPIDSRAVAKTYLRGQAFRMARNVVQNGTPRDHVRTLQLLGDVLDTEKHGPAVIVQIGVGPGDVQVQGLTPRPPLS